MSEIAGKRQPSVRSPARASRPTLSASTARRIALAAQGFGLSRRTRAVNAEHIRSVTSQIGLLQLDSVNVFCRAHYMPVYSRLGPYDRSLLDAMAAHVKTSSHPSLIEYMAHEASLLPVEMHHLFRWRMARVDQEAWAPIVKLAKARPEVIAAALRQVVNQGPIRASAIEGLQNEGTTTGLWNFKEGSAALEYLFYAGQITAAGRSNFERLYDLPDRVLPPRVLRQRTLSESDAQRQLVRIASQALGVATESDLGDYLRLTRSASKARVAELVEAEELTPVSVEGWNVIAYLWPDALRPRTIGARTLLAPFDPLVWNRERTARLFGFQYTIEIYTPAAKRVYGYYVLPFLLGDALVARVDLKSDRKAGVLAVQGAFSEDGVDRERVASELAVELLQVSTWLGLNDVVVQSNGNLAAQLRAAL